jgi:hypothetical protein
MTDILHFFYRFCLFFVIILSSGCLSSLNPAHSSTELSALYSPYKMSASQYLSQAEHSYDGPKQAYQLMAVGAYLIDEQVVSAEKLLLQIQPQDAKQHAEKQVLFAKIYLLKHQPKLTVETLADIRGLENLDLYYQCEYHELLALAYQMQNRISEAAIQRMKLDILLTNAGQVLSNRQKMWGLMQAMPTPELNIQLMESEHGSVWQGWLKLTKMMRAQTFNEKWVQWADEFPNHPAMMIVKRPSRWSFMRPIEVRHPRKIALLLPMSGSLSGPGSAVSAGFMDAYKESGSNSKVVVYDSAKGVISQYHRAIDEGADVIVGPLTKQEASSVATTFTSVPTLLLNDFSHSLSSSKYSFGYSPKDEAAQLANIMHEKGYQRIMMIIPNNAWGSDVSSAFANAARKHDMQIVSTVNYSSSQNMSQNLRQALNYQEHKTSNSRGRKTIESSRRQDVDAIFILAYPSMARQIVPLLKYYYAGDIPTYATSASYAANYNPTLDKDLDGLYFLDIPWVFNHQIGARNWPEPWNTYSRLYALGYDSYAMTQEWQSLQSMPQSGLSKKTGVLYMMSSGHIRRELVLGQIRQGVAREVSGWLRLGS